MKKIVPAVNTTAPAPPSAREPDQEHKAEQAGDEKARLRHSGILSSIVSFVVSIVVAVGGSFLGPRY